MTRTGEPGAEEVRVPEASPDRTAEPEPAPARESRAGDRSGGRPGVLRDYTEASLVAVLVFLFLNTFAFQQSKIPSASMEDTLRVGDRILVNKYVFAPTGPLRSLLPAREPRRGDVVVFKSPRNPGEDFIKRVIGLPGETVLVLETDVFVDGRLLEEPYAVYRRRRPPGRRRTPERLGPYRVPDGEYFLLGDNRDESSDSRVWGPVPRGMIRGRAARVLLSWEAPTRAEARPEDRGVQSLLRRLGRLRGDRFFHPIR